MKNSFLAFSILICYHSLTSISFAQERTLTGVVTTLDNVALVTAEVKVLSSKTTVLTNVSGKFTVKCLVNDKIKVTARGFNSQKIKIDENTTEANINLTFTPTEKKVIQAVGYGYIKEEDKSYAISNITNGEENNFEMYSNMIDLIVNSSTSVGFSNGGFVIRGGSSLLGSNHALIILDGREANINQLYSLSPVEVKSVDVLKGAASSIYGSRGANGVVIILTKKSAEDM